MKELHPYIAPRTCTEVDTGKSPAKLELGSQPLEKYSDEGAYVLLAPPGSGKTSEFQRQADLYGGLFVTARDFITFDDKREWHDRTLFIDGLDEVRAGSADGKTPLDGIRNKLLRLGKPEFRLSCREADWFGANDRRHLESVAPQGKIMVLRLDPLAKEGINTVLHKNHNVEDPDAFVDAAQQRGVAALLENPLSLKLLAKAVMNNEWPDSRIHTFEMACKTLADEFNEEHQVAKVRERANTEVLLDTAGQLCAVQLLAGAQGIRLGPGSQDDCHIELNELAGASRALQLDSLKTRLFEAPNSDFAIPLHRQVAEFLGARYLAGLVGNGLPVNRILALTSGHDGMIVTEMRGLCAWLAVHSSIAREEIIRRDPIGTVLYGDVARFSVQSKKLILGELEHVSKNDRWFLDTITLDSRLGDLVSKELTNEILAILENSIRNGGRQSLTLFLVETLCHAQPLEGMTSAVMEIIRDETRWTRIRQKAIDAFMQQRGDKRQALEDLKLLMQEVYLGGISDSDDDLLGTLLDKTYPSVLPGTEVLDYLRGPKVNQFLSNEVFWTLKLPQKTTCKQKEELLDELASRYDALGMEARQTEQSGKVSMEIPLILLDRYLAECSGAEKVGSRRLFLWLAVAGRVGDWNYDVGFSDMEREHVRSWLSQRPELWKALVKLGLKRCKDGIQESGSPDYQQSMWMYEERILFGAKRPLDFANWCLNEALVTDDTNAKKWLVRRVADEIEDERISRALVDARIGSNKFLQNALQERIGEHVERKAWDKRQGKKERIVEQKEQKEEHEELSQWQITVQDHKAELIENRAPMGLLHNLAKAYFGGYHGMREYTPHERLGILLGENSELVDSVLAGLRAVVFRPDLPTAEDVIRQGALNQMYYSSFPFLAGFNELSCSNQEGDFSPDESQSQLVIAYYYNVTFWLNPWGHGDDELQPDWLEYFLENRPEIVAKSFKETVVSRLQKGMELSHMLYKFAYSVDHKKVAQLATLSILKSFPIRCKSKQLSSLRFLLMAAIRHNNRHEFLKLVKRKLVYPSMNVGQCVYWLVAGFISDQHLYSERLSEFVKGKKRRVYHLSSFIEGIFESLPEKPDQLPNSSLSVLIQLLGAEYPPHTLTSNSDLGNENGGIIYREMGISFRIENFINQLMSDPSKQASKELGRLVEENSLVIWRPQIQYAIHQQKDIRREAVFEHADVSKILSVLKNQQPANPADLAALVLDCLKNIANNIKDGNTSDWRQYWNVDSHNRAERPKPEDACRDALLSDLQSRMELLDVDAQPEGRYAEDKRADIRVSFGEFNVPIEIKRSCHPDLWTAIRTQLIAKYTRDPGAGGHGIYLVFWFGNHKYCRPTPDANPPPKSADKFEHRLEESLTDAERRKISICMIDVEDRNNLKEPESERHE